MVRANVRRGAVTSRTAPPCLAMGPCARSRSESPSRAGLPAPACAFAAGEMGIGNTTTSAAVAAVLIRRTRGASSARRGALGRLARAQARRGRARYRRELARSRRPDRRALEGGRLRHRGDVRLLPGGRGLEGAGALDGVISCTAALCAVRLCPNALGYLVGTHASSEPASRELLRELGIKGTPRRRHARARRGRHGVSAPSGFGAARVPGWGRRSRRLAWLLTSISRPGNGGDARHRAAASGRAPRRVPVPRARWPSRLPGNDGALRGRGEPAASRAIGRCARARGFPPSSARVTWAPQCPGFRAAARFFFGGRGQPGCERAFRGRRLVPT